jgi:predicted RNA binding protein YcfA (HicA-like mRNA interferase family)
MKKFTSNKDFNVYIKHLCRVGWLFKRGKKHGKLVSPTGNLYIVPGSPSDCRALYKFRRDIKNINAMEAL